MATIEVMGVKLEISPDVLDDIDVIESVADLNDPDADGSVKASAAVRIMRLVFGDDYARIKRELREKNDGRLGMDLLGKFFGEVCEALGKQAKN